MMLIKFYIRVLFHFNVYCFKNKTQKANFCKIVCFMRTDLWPLLSTKGRIPLDTRRRGRPLCFSTFFSSCPTLVSTRLPLGLTGLGHLQSVFALKAFVSPLEKPPPMKFSPYSPLTEVNISPLAVTEDAPLQGRNPVKLLPLAVSAPGWGCYYSEPHSGLLPEADLCSSSSR